ncbi:decapping and exoribonuclease protein-like [Nerophis lumbriciformis]|uniref:decapping and exoribonuclease protein-like n=1 Tax=Nerophis lumbriciformis TaxID=546530 RepID=UPI002ADFE366|nr:decapping and exoribonuclease protein-like [Nerophis lumbriciformis]XP_061830373.1 decapping and exoribonuclease protein-like [Nerophis lumbriciformis]
MSLSTHYKNYVNEAPPFEKRVEVGSFSLDTERRVVHDKNQMRYYVEPHQAPQFDLRDGYKDRYVKRDESLKKSLDHILRWILANKSNLKQKALSSSSSSALDFDFVTSRGRLTHLLTTPYQKMSSWLLAVTKFRGTLYINEVKTEAARQSETHRTESHEENIYWGYKFEQYMCSDTIDGVPDSSGVVNSNEAFYIVVQTRLADHSLLFSGELDCRDKDPNAPDPPACYIELKTAGNIHTAKQRDKFHRYKLNQWWAQSYLLGVPRIVAGFRNDDGIVESVKTFQVSDIPEIAEREVNFWKPNVCMNFCSKFLSFVKKVATEDDPCVVYLFSRKEHSDVTYSVHRNSSYSFLPDWYVKEMD